MGVGDGTDGDFSDIMRFTPVGNVGIGTSLPMDRLTQTQLIVLVEQAGLIRAIKF